MCLKINNSVFVFAALILLAACQTAQIQGVAYGDPCNYPVQGNPPVVRELFLNALPPNGSRAGDALKDETSLRAALYGMGAYSYNLKSRISSVRFGPSARGLAGIQYWSFLRAADHAHDGNNFRSRVEFETTGRLEAYHYDKSGNGPSCMRVLMTTTAKRPNGNMISIAYRWTVFAELKVSPRDDSDQDNVFPEATTLPISAQIAGPRQYKMWAEGSMINVTRVERIVDGGSPVLLGRGHRFYRTNAESCIDMMFIEEPEETMPPGMIPPFYCLGRCDHPPLINTGD